MESILPKIKRKIVNKTRFIADHILELDFKIIKIMINWEISIMINLLKI